MKGSARNASTFPAIMAAISITSRADLTVKQLPVTCLVVLVMAA